MNMATVIAVYASLCKEMGLPFRYPGSTSSYSVLMEMTDAELLAKAMVWAGETERCNGQGFQHHQRRLQSLATHLAAPGGSSSTCITRHRNVCR
jgi:hypothetical protein